jgi:hypothetical protein
MLKPGSFAARSSTDLSQFRMPTSFASVASFGLRANSSSAFRTASSACSTGVFGSLSTFRNRTTPHG